MPNPFYYGGHVNPDQFVGRRAELQRIFAGLEVAHTGQMQSFSVVGPRRIGKSSLLFYVTNRYANYLKDSGKYRFAYVDLQDASCKTLDGLLRTILHELHLTLRRSKVVTLADFQNEIVEFKRAGRLPIVCLDEFEDLAHNTNEFKHDLYDSWRHLMNENALAFITASKVPLIDLAQTLGYTSPFFNVFTYLLLGELTDDEARELIARGANCDRPFTPTEQNEALLLAGKHPYKLQLAGNLFYLAKSDNRMVDCEVVRHEFVQQLQKVGLEEPSQIHWVARSKDVMRRLASIPKFLGRALLDFFGRDKVSESTDWILGIAILIVVLLVFFGWVSFEQIKEMWKLLIGKGN